MNRGVGSGDPSRVFVAFLSERLNEPRREPRLPAGSSPFPRGRAWRWRPTALGARSSLVLGGFGRPGSCRRQTGTGNTSCFKLRPGGVLC